MGTSSDVCAVHQVIPWLHVADASGAHTVHARSALREAGYESEIFVDHVDPPLAHEVRSFDELDDVVVTGRTVLLYQLAVGSELVGRLLSRREPIFVNYHNLTPADFFWKWAPDWLSAVESGRQQLHRLAPRVSHAIAVSEFNRRDLEGAGYRSTSVVPPFVDVGSSGTASGSENRSRTVHREGGRGARWLFVGKLLPHKAAHDLLKALALYRRVYDPEATLVLVGGHPIPPYAAAVEGYAQALGLTGAVELTGSVSSERLAESYAGADVFVCLSDHEGFCFPLLEAMGAGLPVVAFDAGAVADTLGDSGVLLRDKSPATVASAVHLLRSDDIIRRRLVEAGRRRLEGFGLVATKRRFIERVRAAIGRL